MAAKSNVGPTQSKPVMFYPAAFPYAWGNRVSKLKALSFAHTSVTLHDGVFYGGALITLVRT